MDKQTSTLVEFETLSATLYTNNNIYIYITNNKNNDNNSDTIFSLWIIQRHFLQVE